MGAHAITAHKSVGIPYSVRCHPTPDEIGGSVWQSRTGRHRRARA